MIGGVGRHSRALGPERGGGSHGLNARRVTSRMLLSESGIHCKRVQTPLPLRIHTTLSVREEGVLITMRVLAMVLAYVDFPDCHRRE